MSADPTHTYQPGEIVSGNASAGVKLNVSGPGNQTVANLSPAAMREKPRRIALVGYTESQRDAPWDDDGWEVWGLNNLHKYIREKDGSDYAWGAWFDLHDRRTIDADPEHVEWLRKPHDFPIYVWDPDPEWPSAVPYPRDDVLARYRHYFTNSISWMMALAMDEVAWAIGDGATVGLWGIDMAEGTEYAAQRPSVEYLVGLAEGRGIEVTVAETSDLLKTIGQYGSPEADAFRGKVTERIEGLKGRLAEARSEYEKGQAQLRLIEKAIDQMTGALEANNYWLGTWVPPGTDKTKPRAATDVRAGQES